MFAHQKKDYYSVNADIAIEANQQQRQFENAQMTSMLQNEGMNMGAGTNYDDQSNQFGDQYPPGSEGQDPYGAEVQNDQYEQQQMQLMMLEEQMSGPQAVRYDDVYYPRTDKRAISKFDLSYLCLAGLKTPIFVHQLSVFNLFDHLIPCVTPLTDLTCLTCPIEL